MKFPDLFKFPAAVGLESRAVYHMLQTVKGRTSVHRRSVYIACGTDEKYTRRGPVSSRDLPSLEQWALHPPVLAVIRSVDECSLDGTDEKSNCHDISRCVSTGSGLQLNLSMVRKIDLQRQVPGAA